MKKIISTALLMTSFSLASCEGLHNQIWSNTVEADQIDSMMDNPDRAQAKTPVKTNSPQKTADEKPKIATIKSLIKGDLKCYVVLVDEQSANQELGATFDVCAEGEKFLSTKVNLTYDTVKVNDCQSNEPCEKTKDESLIVKIDPLNSASTKPNKTKPNNYADIVTLTNGKWTITIGDRNSWDGVNGTGNLTYYGCSSGGKCIKLRGGQVNCQEGECTIAWKNGNQDYIVKGGITAKNGEGSMSPSTLIVLQGNTVIATAEGLQPLN